MLKLSYSKENINVNKLHVELGDLGEKYFLTHNETELFLSFPDLFKREINVNDEQGNITETVVTYEKKTTSSVTVKDEEENEVIKELDTYTVFDFISLQTTIDSIIAAHDPTPPQMLPTFEDRVAELENTILFILGGM